jgi:hypothetical protein
MLLVTRMAALQAEEQRREIQWHSSSVNSCRKTRTVQQPQPDAANPNTAESMMQTPRACKPNILSENELRAVGVPLEFAANPVQGRSLDGKVEVDQFNLAAEKDNVPWVEVAFSVWTQFTVSTGKKSELPRGMPMVTRVFASSEHAWDPMASSSVNFCRKTRTVQCTNLSEVCSVCLRRLDRIDG